MNRPGLSPLLLPLLLPRLLLELTFARSTPTTPTEPRSPRQSVFPVQITLSHIPVSSPATHLPRTRTPTTKPAPHSCRTTVSLPPETAATIRHLPLRYQRRRPRTEWRFLSPTPYEPKSTRSDPHKCPISILR